MFCLRLYYGTAASFGSRIISVQTLSCVPNESVATLETLEHFALPPIQSMKDVDKFTGDLERTSVKVQSMMIADC